MTGGMGGEIDRVKGGINDRGYDGGFVGVSMGNLGNLDQKEHYIHY